MKITTVLTLTVIGFSLTAGVALLGLRNPAFGDLTCYMQSSDGQTTSLEEICGMEGVESTGLSAPKTFSYEGIDYVIFPDSNIARATGFTNGRPEGFEGELPTEEESKFIEDFIKANNIQEGQTVQIDLYGNPGQ